jgi:hypothetical protein
VTPRAKVGAGALLVAAFVALGIGQRALDASARATLVQAPRFEVDPLWPKPLPNHWVLGNVIGVGVDANDHVFIVHRNDTFDARNEIGAAQKPPLSECCVPAPPVLEFDPAGNLVKAWGGPPEDKQYVWPSSNHGISIDNKNNVWIGGNGGRGDAGSDSHILKFTHDGKFLMQIGEPGQAAASPRSPLTTRRTKRSSPTATGTSASPCSTWTTGRSSASGARTATCPRTRTSGRMTRVRRSRSSSAIPCTAPSRRRTVWSTCATA